MTKGVMGILSQKPSTASRLINVAVFLDYVCWGMILPISMVYFLTFGKVGLATIGQIFTLAGILALPMGIPGGMISDRLSPKNLLVLYNLLNAVGYVIYLLPITRYSIFAALFITSIAAKFYYTGWTNFVNDLSAGIRYEQKFSVFETIKMASMAFGSAVSLFSMIFWGNNIVHSLMILSVILSLASALLLYRAPIGGRRSMPKTHWRQVFQEAKRLFTYPAYRRIIAAQLFLAPVTLVLPYTMGAVFVKIWHMPLYVNNVLFFINMLFIALFQIPLNRKFNQYSLRISLYTTMGFFALALLPYIWWHQLAAPYTWILAVSSVMALSFAIIIYAPPVNSLMAKKAQDGLAGQTMGVFQTSATVGLALYPLFLGLIEGPYAWCVWIGTFACFVVGLFLFIRADRSDSQ